VGHLLICYSAAYMTQSRQQQCFTISKVAADWHELMTQQHIMGPSFARTERHAVQLADMSPPESATLGFHPIAHTTFHFPLTVEG